MNLAAYVARAFCHNSNGGNPAGFVIETHESLLTLAQMRDFAKIRWITIFLFCDCAKLGFE